MPSEYPYRGDLDVHDLFAFLFQSYVLSKIGSVSNILHWSCLSNDFCFLTLLGRHISPMNSFDFVKKTH